MIKVVIAGGGTGGHLFPGIALALEFKRREQDAQLLFVGTSRGLENTVVPRLGFALKTIRCQAVSGLGLMQKLKALFLLPTALLSAVKILKKFGPDLVLGVGGYASGPVVAAARLLGVDTAICEQNLVPGLTNRLLARLAKKVFVSYPETVAAFPRGRAIITGNPVREGLTSLSREGRNGSIFTILILGGSQGAKTVNAAVLAALDLLRPLKDSLHLIHQTGEEEREKIAQQYRKEGFAALVTPFLEDMTAAYAQADLVVARAGATTIAELCAAGLPAILIPYPFAASDHQRVNARNLALKGAAVMIEPERLNGETLACTILKLVKDRPRRKAMARQAKALSRPQAAREIVDICYTMAGKVGGS